MLREDGGLPDATWSKAGAGEPQRLVPSTNGAVPTHEQLCKDVEASEQAASGANVNGPSLVSLKMGSELPLHEGLRRGRDILRWPGSSASSGKPA